MSVAEPKNLVDLLNRLEQTRKDPTDEPHRRFRRFIIRGDAIVEPLQSGHSHENQTVMLRDISRGGLAFLSRQFFEPGTLWRIRFQRDGMDFASHPIAIRFARRIQDDLFLIGGQFVIEPFILTMLGVGEDQLRNDCRFDPDERDTSDMNGIEKLAD